MMVIGRIFREGGGWSAHCDDVGVATQGFTRDEARANLVEAVEQTANRPGLKVDVIDLEGETVYVQANIPWLLAAEVLRHHRQMNGMSIEDVASKIGGEHGAAYEDYEEGRREPSMSTYLELLQTIVPSMTIVVRERKPANDESPPPAREAAR